LAAPKAGSVDCPKREVLAAVWVDPNMFEVCCGCEKAAKKKLLN